MGALTRETQLVHRQTTLVLPFIAIFDQDRDPMSLAAAYESLILWIGDGTGASDSLLHVHAGLAVLLAARIITGKSLATPIPFASVCVAEIANEILDRINHGSWLWRDTSMDIVNTLFWPFVLMVGLRARRLQQAHQGSSEKGG
jgi:hypothetical protein